MSEMNPQPMRDPESPSRSPLSSFASSPVVVSLKSGWSALPQKTKLMAIAAAALFLLVAALIGVSILGAVASTVFGGSKTLEAVVSTVNGDYGDQQLNKGIKNLKVVKDVRNGRLTISFDWRANEAGYPHHVGRGLLVRLFDKDGRYLTHFVTQETFLDIMGQREEEWKGDRFELNYAVNEVVLESAAKAEVGGMI